jgi:hypothetical protein
MGIRAFARRAFREAELGADAMRALIRAARLVRGASPDALVRTLRAAAAEGPKGPVDAGHTREIAAIARAVRVLGRAFGSRRCLIEALATAELLRARSLPCTLRFSVSRDRGALLAHAWLESGGLVVIGDGPGVHTPLERTQTTRSEATPA